ncbi:uncharacterized protein J4E88_009417 [Alternaria novae-zelandiae]|uniref:uncharacterized protein n=1 Tax=Alternaria novae-zelandiae TaxID=430562 RepID=UPI0020C54AE3|nr:uncharacterized protein J4E88_009417 [Alternaria novae-zelandiae]KAI4671022.1 hypothetical protein J4E88_009417 [Alternaria novae-zelandiae]
MRSSETFQNAYAVPFHEPAVDHHGALLPRVAASTNGNLPLAQPEHDAGTQYPAEYPWQANPWNAAALDVYRPGSFNLNAGLHDESLNLSYGEFHPEPAFSIALMAPAWDFNCIQDFDQSNIPIGSAAQLNEASYPGMVSATPAQAPAPAAANRIRCPHGCPATFGRGGEYRRHMMIHEPARYRCPMVDCPKTFSRADKLRDHAKRGHGGRNPLRL